MQTIAVAVTIDAPIERVWAAISNHQDMVRWPGIRRVVMRQRGISHPDGVGAIREVTAVGAWFVEEIRVFEPPRRLRYQIVESRPRLDHDGGEVLLSDQGGRTHVAWTSRVRLAVPVVGGLLTRVMKPVLSAAFMRCLRFVKRELERSATGVVAA